MAEDNSKEKKWEDKTKQEKEDVRAIALANLMDVPFGSMALAYIIEKDKDFGEEDGRIIHDYKYVPAMKKPSELVSNHITKILEESRQDGRRYTGSVNEFQIIEACGRSFMGSLTLVKSDDLLKLVGSDKQVKSQYADKYVRELDEKERGEILGPYLKRFIKRHLSDAYAIDSDVALSDLEKKLCDIPKEPELVREAA